MKKILLSISLVLILAVAAYLLLHKESVSIQDAAAESAVASIPNIIFPVHIQIAVQQDLIRWIHCSGLARPIKEAGIITQTSGHLDSLNAHNGKYIEKGDLLVRLDDAAPRLALRDAENNLLSSSIEYNIIKSGPSALLAAKPFRLAKQIDSLSIIYRQAEQDFHNGDLDEGQLRRIRRNYESLLTYRDFDRDDVIANKCGLNQALVEYDRAKLNLAYCELRAPFSGYVADCELVPGGSFIYSGFQCLKLIDLSRVNVIADVTESQISKIRIGHAAEVRFVAYNDAVQQGHVTEINPYIDLEKRTGKVTVEIANAGHRFKPGMFANVRIQGDVVAAAITIPKAALVMRDNRPVVFLAQQGLAKWRYVEIGAENEEYYQITNGVSAGDSVIVEGNYNLAHDARIDFSSSEK